MKTWNLLPIIVIIIIIYQYSLKLNYTHNNLTYKYFMSIFYFVKARDIFNKLNLIISIRTYIQYLD